MNCILFYFFTWKNVHPILFQEDVSVSMISYHIYECILNVLRDINWCILNILILSYVLSNTSYYNRHNFIATYILHKLYLSKYGLKSEEKPANCLCFRSKKCPWVQSEWVFHDVKLQRSHNYQSIRWTVSCEPNTI